MSDDEDRKRDEPAEEDEEKDRPARSTGGDSDKGIDESDKAEDEDAGRKKDREKDRKKDKKDRRRSRSRSRSRDRRRRSRSRSRERSKRRSRSRSRSRDRRRRSRSGDRDRKRGSRRSRSHSRSRPSRRSRSRSRDRRRRDRSSSPEYGGYKPRKKADAPPVATGPGTGADPFAALRQPVAAVDPIELNRMWQEQQLRARQMVLQQQAASAAAAASKTQREVYVGNLVPGAVNEPTLMQLFNTALMVRFPGSNVPGMEPVIKVNLHSDGRYAFVEFRTPEMATAALDLSGQVQFLGQAMTVNRPSGYVDPNKASVAAQAAAQALQAFQRGDLTALQAANMAGANLGGLGVMAARPAIPTIPGMALPGMAMPGVGFGAAGALQSAAVAQTVATALVPGAGVLGMPGAAGLPTAVAAAPAGAPALDGLSAVPTTAICVIGMITSDVLKDEQECKDVIEDLQEECNKHAPGTVRGVKVPRPPQPELAAQYFGQGNFGKAFVQFADPTSASKAKDAIHGRMFAGSAVQVAFITPDAFARVQ